MSYTRYFKLILFTIFLIRTCFGQASCFPLDGTDANHPNGLFVKLVPTKQYSGPRKNAASTYVAQIPQGALVLFDPIKGPQGVTATSMAAAVKTELSTCLPQILNPPTPTPQPMPFTNTPVALGAIIMVVADFNRDGNADVAAVAPGGNQSTVYLGNADGTFQAPVTTTLGNASTKLSSIGLGDFNGDKRLDLAILDTGNNAVYVLLGKGDGTFFGKSDGPFAPVTIPVGHSPGALIVSDVNGDGFPDIAVANTADNTVSVVRGIGDGTFFPALVFPVGKNPVSVLAQDINMDGNIDLIVADSGSNDLAVLFGLGNGGFQNAVFTKTPAPPTYLASADFNDDGIPDMVALAEDANAVMMFTGAFHGKLTLAGAFTVPNLTSSVMISDIDGDGYLDLLLPDTDSGSAVVLLGRGDGTLYAPPVYGLNNSPTPGATSGFTSIATGDFHNSGKLDLIATGSNATTSSLSLLTGMGNGQFQLPVNIPVSGRTDVVAVGDFNKDGRLDIAVSGSQLNILLGQGNGTFTPGAQYPNLVPAVVADFNKDGRLDIAGPSNGKLGILLGNGDGTFRPAVSSAVGSNPLTAVSADFNHDGIPDIAVLNGGTPGSSTDPGGVSILLGNGTATFPNVTNVTTGVNPTAIAVGDVNGDGKPDLVVGAGTNGSSYLYVLLGKGDGTFSSQFSIAVPAGETTNTIAILDLDGDGNPDIVAGDCCADASTVYFRGNGDGTFQPPIPFFGGNNVRAIAVGDWNGDGKPDMALGYSSSAAPSPGAVVSLVNHLGVVPAMVNTSGASFLPGPIAPDSIVALFGTNMTTATSPPLTDPASPPTMLAGTTLTVKDSKGVSRMARLFLVSPTQINYLVPAQTALGMATVSVVAPNGVTTTPVNVNATSPGLFTVNSSGIPAGSGVIVHGSTQSGFNFEFTDSTGAVTLLPINMGTRLDRVYLTLYGTGLRNRTSLDLVSVTIGGVYTPPLYAGPQSQYPGLDQINFQIPFSLAGSGNVAINVSVNGAAANPVNVTIQ